MLSELSLNIKIKGSLGESLGNMDFCWNSKNKTTSEISFIYLTPFNLLSSVSVSRPTTNLNWKPPCSWTGCAWNPSRWCGCPSSTAWPLPRPPSTRPSATSARNAPSSGSGPSSYPITAKHCPDVSLRRQPICQRQLHVRCAGSWRHSSSEEYIFPLHFSVLSIPRKHHLLIPDGFTFLKNFHRFILLHYLNSRKRETF